MGVNLLAKLASAQQLSCLPITSHWSTKYFSKIFLLAVGCSGLGVSLPATASETIILMFEQSEVVIPVEHLATFAKTGEAQHENVRQFVEKHPRAGEIIQNLFAKEIVINPTFADQDFKTPLGEFLIVQLNRVLGIVDDKFSPRPMYSSLKSSYRDDNRISLLELVENYPNPTIEINLISVQNAYESVKAFLEEKQPQLSATRESIREFVCRCSQTTSLLPTSGTRYQLKSSTLANQACDVRDRQAQPGY